MAIMKFADGAPGGARAVTAAIAGSVVLASCTQFDTFTRHDAEAGTIQGPPVTDNTTPLERSFTCMADRIRAQTHKPLRLTVGQVEDYTGKFSEQDGGHPITQGGSQMVISALGKLDDSVRLFERFDTSVADREQNYRDNRRLGDGQEHTVPADGGGEQRVPWVPYFGGTVMQTDYFIVGGITELNWNVATGGAEARVDGMGPRARTYTVNVAADLRIVDTESLEVMGTTSLQKQIVGYEVGAEIFNFFGTTLIDLNAGNQSQEPLQLGVRTTLELGVLELVGNVTGVDHTGCVSFDSLTDQPDPEVLAASIETDEYAALKEQREN